MKLRVLLLVVTLASRGRPAVAADPQVPPLPSRAPYEQALDLSSKAGDHEGALRLLNPYVDELRKHTELSLFQLRLSEAYELRGRIRVPLGDRNGAIEDFTALLRLNPDYIQPSDMSQQTVSLVDTVRATLIGTVLPTVLPLDSELTLDGERIVSATERRVLAGSHRIGARRPGYRAEDRQITVVPGATSALDISLVRESAVLSIVAIPADAQVYLDGVLAGTASVRETPGIAPDGSGTLRIDGVKLGDHRLEVRRLCYATQAATVHVTSLDDLELPQITLSDARGALTVSANMADADVVIDGRSGKAPFRAALCEGEYAIDVRAPEGRLLARQTVTASRESTFKAVLKPTFALVAAPGSPVLPADVVEGIATSLRGLRTLTFWIPPGARSAGEDQDVVLLTSGQRNPGPRAQERRVQLTDELSRRHSVQGVAVVSRAASGDERYRIDLFARGSAEPNDLYWIDDRDQNRETRERLDEGVPLFRRTIGLALADLTGFAGPVVVIRSPDGKFEVGDMVRRIDGQPVDRVAAIDDLRLPAVGA